MATQNALNLSLSGQSGTAMFAGTTSPTFTTPALGVATATSVNGLTVTTTTGTLTVASGKTLTQDNSLTFTGTDGSSVNFGAGGTVSYGGSGITWTQATSTPISAPVNHGYVITDASTVTINLPTTATYGDAVAIQGGVTGVGMWVLAPGSGGNIQIGSANAVVSVAATNQYDAIEVRCISPGSSSAVTWSVASSQTAGFTYS